MKSFTKKNIVPSTILCASLLCGCTSASSAASEKTDTASATSTTSTTAVTAYNQATTPHYDVVLRNTIATVDGNLDEEVWASVPAISGGFHLPWDAKEAPVTIFKAYNDGDTMYFAFEVSDPDVLVEEEWKDDESTVDAEDRVELFFAGGAVDKPTSDGMPLYYGVEIDPDGRVHDYSIEYYRNFDGTWDLEGLESAGKKTNNGYIVEASVPLQTLENLKLLQNNIMRTGVYRAEFSTPENADEETIMEWISWVDPKTETPDFHVDASFGEFRFLK